MKDAAKDFISSAAKWVKENWVLAFSAAVVAVFIVAYMNFKH